MARLLAGLAALCLAACDGGPPQIRVANRGDVALERVRVTFLAHAEDYGTLGPGAASDYRPIPKAYSCARIEAVAHGEPLRLQPIDFVGDEPLGGGRYTYALAFDPAGATALERLRFEFIED